MSVRNAQASNWVAERAEATASAFDLKGSSKSYTSFSRAFSAGDTVFYSAHDEQGNREAGYGVFNGSTEITRNPTATLVNNAYNSNSPSKVSFSGEVTVACTFNASAFNTLWKALDAIDPDGDGGINIPPELIEGLVDTLNSKADQVDLEKEIQDRIDGDQALQDQIDALDPDGDLVIDWSEIEGKPTEFPPEAHNHDGVYAPVGHGHEIDDVNGLQDALDAAGSTPAWDDVTGKPTEFPPAAHTQDWSTITNTPSEYPPEDHTHEQGDVDGLESRLEAIEDSITSGGGFVDAPNDGRLYGRQSEAWAEVVIPDGGASSWDEIADKPTEFPPASHSQGWDTITDKPAEFPPEDHTHLIADITDFDPADYQPAGEYVGEAPNDGKPYVRKSEAWEEMPTTGGGGDSLWEQNLNDIYYDAGNVGIGTDNPQRPLVISNGGAQGIEIGHDGASNQTFLVSIDRAAGSYTPIFFNAYDFKFDTTNTERMRIDANGRVGIGNEAPFSKVDIKTSPTNPLASAESQLALRNGGGRATYFTFDNDANMTIYNTAAGDGSGGDTVFHQGSGEVMRITADGNVGIGAQIPTAKLSVNGTYASETEGLQVIGIGQNSGQLSPISFHLQSVGWGTRHQATISAEQVSGSNGGADLFFSTSTTGFDNPTERMRITSGGNVGIGTSSPDSRLTVEAPTGDYAVLLTPSGDTTGAVTASYIGFDVRSSTANGPEPAAYIGVEEASTNSVQGHLVFATRQTNNNTVAPTEAMRIGSSGNVNIYGTDDRPLAITSFNTVSAGAGWDLDATSSNGVVTISTAGSERMRVDSSGKVGIGKSPSNKLDLLHTADALDGITIRSNNSGSSAGAQMILNGYGNSWGIACGSTAKNSNALTFSIDALGANTERMRIDTTGRVGIGGTPSRSAEQIAKEAKDKLARWKSTFDERLKAEPKADKKAVTLEITDDEFSTFPTEETLVERLQRADIGGGDAKLQVAGDGYFSGTIYGTVADVPAHVKAITPTQIANWDAGTGGGGGATTDGRISDTQITHWDTAYGWGNHATAGYQPAGSYAAASHTHSQYLTSSDLSGYATESWVTSNYQPKGSYLTSSDLNGYATESWVNSQGFAKGSFVPTSGNTTISGTLTATDFVATSDERLKQNATTAPVGLVDQLRGVEFEWKEDGRQDAGVIAQEVEKVLPHLVHDTGEHKAVNYNGLVAYLIEEIKDLKAQVEALK